MSTSRLVNIPDAARDIHRPQTEEQLAEAVRALAADVHPNDVARALRLDPRFVRRVLETSETGEAARD